MFACNLLQGGSRRLLTPDAVQVRHLRPLIAPCKQGIMQLHV